MKAEWSSILVEIYSNCRTMPHWNDLKNLHDAEDKEYFDLLDDHTSNKDEKCGRMENETIKRID